MISVKLWKHYGAKLKWSEKFTLILWRNFKKFFGNNFNEIGKKLPRYLKTFDEHFVKIFTAILGRTYKKLYGKFKQFQRKIVKEPRGNFGNTWDAFENLSGVASKLNPALRIVWYCLYKLSP